MHILLQQKYSELIKSKAAELGFDACGISKADFLEEEAPRLEKWLNQNYHGKMAYMANHFDKRLDPRKLVDGAKSVITVILNYFPEETLPENDDNYKISKYAYGTDYHFVLKDKLKDLMAYISEEIGEVNGRVFVDSAPVMDKFWAKKKWNRLGRKTHKFDYERNRQFFLYRRNHLRFRTSSRCWNEGLLRHLHPLRRCLPDRCHYAAFMWLMAQSVSVISRLNSKKRFQKK